MPFFSVIIPLYNKENFIEATLKSVLAQTFTDYEIIVIDDGSTDSSASIIKGYTDIRIRYFRTANKGVSSARNYGIQNATANYITFLDADDYWYPNFLDVMFKNSNKEPKIRVFSAAIEIETNNTTFPAAYSILQKNEYEIVNYFSASFKETVICTSCAVFHKTIFDKVGFFDTQLKSGEDTDLWIRIGLEYPVLFSWEILTRYVYDQNSLSKNKNFLHTKPDFTAFAIAEKTDPLLKKFLDLNRFSLAIKFKLAGNKNAFRNQCKAIDRSNLSIQKRIVLLLPAFILQILIRFKTFWTEHGLGSAVFK
ncbi:glycosyltransferase family 2 protein [Flavobacterium sp. PL002]|uniref:glycosyltransferase family 2 protein n=1 Tax=Flavobacterium sp. PL002 TaxID=1897058 RepID=UPI0017878B25|nr:glycosyltransferase family 2 protein [Flavobacterium sp. PL002]MBE0390899.1 putative glycosyltransferase EpsJ [Flavobacterium sp. PL002]